MLLLPPQKPTDRVSNARLLVFGGSLTLVMLAFHLYLNLATHGGTDIVAILFLALAALVIAGFLSAWRTSLRLHPYSLLIFHTVSYLIVVGTVSVHAFPASGSGDRYRLTGGLVWMVAMWSIGLFVHALAANSAQGFDDVDP